MMEQDRGDTKEKPGGIVSEKTVWLSCEDT